MIPFQTQLSAVAIIVQAVWQENEQTFSSRSKDSSISVRGKEEIKYYSDLMISNYNLSEKLCSSWANCGKYVGNSELLILKLIQ